MENFGIVIINPWAVKWAQALLLKTDQNPGLERVATFPIIASREALLVQYEHKLKDSYGPSLIDSIANKPIVLAAYVGGENFYRDILKTKEQVREAYNWRIRQPDQRQFPKLKYMVMHSSSNISEGKRDLGAWADYILSIEGFDLRQRIGNKLREQS